MSKYIGIWILLWALFRFVFHAISYSDAPKFIALIYYMSNDIINIGIFASIHSIVSKSSLRYFHLPNYKLKRLLKTVLIYSTWCLIVDILLFWEIGALDTGFYTTVDMGILGLGTLWAIFV